MSTVLSRFPRHSRLASWLAVVAWCGLIFWLSSQPRLGTSLGTLDLVLRKLAHVIEYAVLAALACNALGREGLAPRTARAAALAFAIAYAISDEWHQTFVDGRVGSPIDVVIDTLGAVLGLLLVRSVTRRGRAEAS